MMGSDTACDLPSDVIEKDSSVSFVNFCNCADVSLDELLSNSTASEFVGITVLPSFK